jgi:hypothetical protein
MTQCHVDEQYVLSETATLVALRLQLEQKDAEIRRLEAMLMRFLKAAPPPLIEKVMKGKP